MPTNLLESTSRTPKIADGSVGCLAEHWARRARPSHINLAGVDLNLLVALDALLQERNVSIAAGRVGLSQPAMSRSLSRLRTLFQDELLVRSSAGYVLTRLAERLGEDLPQVMSKLRMILGNAGTLAGNGRTALTLAMPEHQSLALLQVLISRLELRAPNIDLTTRSLLGNTARQMEQGEVDLAIGCIREDGAGFYRRVLYRDDFVCVVRNGHPILAESWDANRFSALRHAVVASPAEEGFTELYEQLSNLNLPGHDPLVVPNVSTAPFVVAESDMALVLPRRTADKAASLLPLTVLEVPVEISPYEVALLWHERANKDAACMQLRAEIAAVTLSVVQGSRRDEVGKYE